MNLKTLKGFHNSGEASSYEQAIKLKHEGAQLFLAQNKPSVLSSKPPKMTV